MLLKGRTKIVYDATQDDINNISILVDAINTTMPIHMYNKWDIDYLINYRKGVQPVLEKEKKVREEINNKVVINHAQMITRMINGYFLGSPIQYIQNGGSDSKEKIDILNRFVQYEDKSSVDKEVGEYQSVCGTAYKMIYTDGLYEDEVPFEEKALNPSTTYVVYENSIAEKPLMAVTFLYLTDEIFGQTTKIYAYTKYAVYEFLVSSDEVVREENLVSYSQYNVGGVPIIEYPNNIWRIGDWELCLGLMDSINTLQSNRLDDIEQVVQSLMVFINADIDSDKYDEMREGGIISLKNTTNNSADVKLLTNTLNQSGLNMYSQELEDLLYALVGIPNRNDSSKGGGDTGQAVELRDGWADLEIVAKNKEPIFKRAEKQALKIILTILNNKTGLNLSLLDVDVKFTRNKNNNLLVKAQSYVNLLSTKTLSPADCLTIIDLVSDVNEYISRGESFWGDDFANKASTNMQNSEPNTNNEPNNEPANSNDGNEPTNNK